jgi:c-di-GMP-related signal transduction protein
MSISCSPEEYATMQTLWKESTSRSFSGYARKILLGKPVIVKCRNVSLDALIDELNQLRNQLEQAMIRNPSAVDTSLTYRILQMIRAIADKISEQCVIK